MALGDNAILPLFQPADGVTCAASAAITAARFVKISGNFQQTPTFVPATPLVKGNLMQVALCVGGDIAFGVSAWDAPAADDILKVYRGNIIVPMVSGAATTAGVKVMSDAAGAAIPWTFAASDANNPCGIAVSAAVGALVYVALFV